MSQQVERPLLFEDSLIPLQQGNDIYNAVNHPSPNTLVCPVCGEQKQMEHFYKISQHCTQFGHFFCLDCICNQLKRCISQNEQMSCIIDACPNKISERSVFFTKISKQLNDEYVIWKNSSKFKRRDRSLRMSFRQRVSFHQKSKIDQSFISENLQKQNFDQLPQEQLMNERDEADRQQYNRQKINKTGVNTFSIDKQQQNRGSKEKKGYKKKENRHRQLNQQEQIMPKVPQFPLVPRQVNHQHSKVRFTLEQRSYNICRFIAKTFLLLIGLPFVIAQGIGLLALTIVYYTLFITSVLLIFGFLFGCGYYIWRQQPQLKLAFLSLLGMVFSVGLFRSCLSSYEQVKYLCIKNVWILWMKQMRFIIYYPSLPIYILS